MDGGGPGILTTRATQPAVAATRQNIFFRVHFFTNMFTELVRESSHRLRAQEVQNQKMKRRRRRRRRRRGLSVVGGGCGGQIQGSLIKQQLLELRGIFDNQNQLFDSVHINEDQRGNLTANELNVFLDTQCTSITTCPTINKPTKLLIVSRQN